MTVQIFLKLLDRASKNYCGPNIPLQTKTAMTVQIFLKLLDRASKNYCGPNIPLQTKTAMADPHIV